MVSAPLLGYWSNKRSFREVMYFALTLEAAGNLMYAVSYSTTGILVARIVVGFAAGLTAVTRAYISAVTTLEDRTKFMAYMSAAAALGFILGPAMGAIIGPGVHYQYGMLIFNELTAAGWIGAALSVSSLLSLIFWFDEPPLDDRLRAARIAAERAGAGKKVNFKALASVARPFGVCLFLFFVCMSTFATFETVSVPFSDSAYGWGVRENALLFMTSGALSVGGFAVLSFAAGFLSDRVLVGFGVATLFFGCFGVISYGGPLPVMHWIMASFALTIGFAVTQALVFSLNSKLFGDLPPGTTMGLLQAVGSISRIVAPLYGSYVFTKYSPNAVFESLSVVITLGFIVFFLNFGVMKPKKPDGPLPGDVAKV